MNNATSAQLPQIPSNALIGDRFVPSKSGKVFECINPATEMSLGSIASCDEADVDDAVRHARQAFESGSWSRMAPSARKKVLLRLADLMEKNADELALLETLDVGKPLAVSRSDDIPGAINCIRWCAEAVDKIYDEIAPTDPRSLSLMRHEPLGVVGAVVPWNFPLMIACWKLGPILASGNSVILKPAEQSPLTALRLAELAVEAGFPEGVFNVVPGFGETAGRALGLHPDVDAISFTGSTEVGKLFLQYSGLSNMKRVSLECGGKSPNVIFEDAYDLDRAIAVAAQAIFYNQGEVCNAASRLLVQDSVKDRVVEGLVSLAEKLQVGDPLDAGTDIGAIVDGHQQKQILDYLSLGQQEGAKLVTGKDQKTPDQGFYVNPAIFTNVQNGMRIAQEEIFGPVLSVIGFRDAAEAIEIANDTIYGLAAGVWTRDINKALDVAGRVKAGVVWVNSFDQGEMSSPFGGFKQSGFGRDKSLHAIQKYTDIKTTWINTA